MSAILTLFGSFPSLRFIFQPVKKMHSVGLNVFLFFLLLWVIGAVCNYIDGSLVLRDGSMGYLQDGPNPFVLLSLGISTYLVYLVVRKFKTAFWGSENDFNRHGGLNNTIDLEENRQTPYQNAIGERLDSILCTQPACKRILWGIKIAVFAVFVLTVYSERTWSEVSGNWNFTFQKYPTAFLYCQIRDAFFYSILIPNLVYVTFMTSLHTIVMVRWLRKNSMFKIVPPAPDRVGGLRPLGEISLILFYIVIVQLLHVFPISIVLQWPLLHQIVYFPFFALAVFVFFAPLMAARRSMWEAKNRALEEELVEYNKLNSAFETLDPSAIEDQARIKNLWEMLKISKERYEMSSSMSVWPYDFRTFIRFLTGILVPAIIYIVQLLLSKSNILSNPRLIMDFLNL